MGCENMVGENKVMEEIRLICEVAIKEMKRLFVNAQEVKDILFLRAGKKSLGYGFIANPYLRQLIKAGEQAKIWKYDFERNGILLNPKSELVRKLLEEGEEDEGE